MKILNMIIRIFILVLFVLVVYMIMLKLTNHSPTIETITISLTSIIGGAIIKLMIDFYKFEGKVTNHMEVTKNTFVKIGNKLDKLETDINELKSDMKLIKNKLKVYS